LFSTDPAHSLSDCLAQQVGTEDTEVAGTGNLFAREIDPEILFARWKQAYSHSIEEAFETFSSRLGVEVRFDQDVIAGLLDLTPPGLDELVCLTELAEMADRKAYDFYVLDTAPGGHTLRFLELPTVVRDWLRTIFGILLKYRQVARLPEASDALVEVSQRVKRMQQIFSDPVRTEALAVVVPTRAAREETGRMVSSLGRAGLRTRRLLVNRAIGAAGDCPRCNQASREQAVEVQQLRDSFGDLDMAIFPQLGGEIRGTEALSNLLGFAPARNLSLAEAVR
jgi:arsenite-transporting ATPase